MCECVCVSVSEKEREREGLQIERVSCVSEGEREGGTMRVCER